MAGSRNKSETATQGRRPWTRGEKWLVGAMILGLAAGIGNWAWMNSLERMPVLKIPVPAEPLPNGYGYFLAAARATPVQWNETVHQVGAQKPDPHPERWLVQWRNPMSPAAVQPTLTGNAAGLALLRQGLSFPCMVPQRILTDYRPLSSFRHLARAAYETSQAQALQRHYAASMDTALDGLSMGERIIRGGAAIHMLVGIACEAMEQRAIWPLVAQVDAKTARQAALRLSAIDAQATPLSDTLTEEKWATQTRLMRTFEKPNWRALLAAMEMNDEANGDQGHSNQTRSLTFVSKRDLLSAYTKQADFAISESKGRFSTKPPPSSGNAFIDNSLTMDLDKLWFKSDQKAVDNRLLATTLALRAYRLDHGSYPASLETLVPAYLPSVPQDPFGSGALHYRLIGSAYSLYSVGPDGKDNGGAPVQRHPGGISFQVWEESHGDIVAGLNE